MSKQLPPDHQQRTLALDPGASILVQAPAGSGKTDLLTRRFLRLLAIVDDPGEIVAITFTKAAAAEMRLRILAQIEQASLLDREPEGSSFDMPVLAYRAQQNSLRRSWRILDVPAQLRITTIDAFCRELAQHQPLLSSFGGSLEIASDTDMLYRRAARRVLATIDGKTTELSAAIESLLRWRDNQWQELEDVLVEMLKNREQWMQDFVLTSTPNWTALRNHLERPFARVTKDAVAQVAELLHYSAGAIDELLSLARHAATNGGEDCAKQLAKLNELPAEWTDDDESLTLACAIYRMVADFLFSPSSGSWKKSLQSRHGFPGGKQGEPAKKRFAELVEQLAAVGGMEGALAKLRALPPTKYSNDEWEIVRASFMLLRRAAAELKIVFAETGTVDFTEIAQQARALLVDHDGLPTDTAQAIGDKIKHLLVDEFQDTSRRQYQLLAGLFAAWPEREGRSCFAVGDPQQSIYSFRQAEVELFGRVRDYGFELPTELIDSAPLLLHPVQLSANFRTAHKLVDALNHDLEQVFAADASIQFASAQPARDEAELIGGPTLNAHFDFMPTTPRGKSDPERKQRIAQEREATQTKQTAELVELIKSYRAQLDAAEQTGSNFRIAVLGRKRAVLTPIAAALRMEGIRFRAVDLEPLAARPEVIDAIALGRALLNAHDRVAWLTVLRAPWAGLSLADLHALCGGKEFSACALADLLKENAASLCDEGKLIAARIATCHANARAWRNTHPDATAGTWLAAAWKIFGGELATDAQAQANLVLLWKTVDALPNGLLDLLGSGISNALKDLTAQPDPASSATAGVQLMTIHKSKGLEFEVVILPELQATSGGIDKKMLTWMERGLDAEESEEGELTEFLIAPFDDRSSSEGSMRKWIGHAIKLRDEAEARRLYYVAVTRAREHLHLFARLEWSEKNGHRELAKTRSGSLLHAAWPALADEIDTQFAIHQSMQEDEPENEHLALAAEAGPELVSSTSEKKQGTKLFRLPPELELPASIAALEQSAGSTTEALYQRHEGGLRSRSLGRAVHSLLEELARAHTELSWIDAVRSLEDRLPFLEAESRALGMSAEEAMELSAEALEITLKAAIDPLCQWILAPHEEAESERGWSGMIKGRLRTVRADRIFRAARTPQDEGRDSWWIIDYKTTQMGREDEAIDLLKLRQSYRSQLESYGDFLRRIKGAGLPINAGLYYPRLGLFDWWELDA